MLRLTDIFGFAIPIWVDTAIGFALGAIIGSYLATILWRWPRGLSANRGRSHCDGCERPLRWYELVPLMGRMFVGGHCPSCGARIGVGHSLFELGCALIGAYCFAFGMVAIAPWAWLLLLLACFDARHLWLPDPLVGALAVIAIVAPLDPQLTIVEQAIGGIAGFGVLWTVARLYRRMRGRHGLGGGDAKLLGAIGLAVGALALPTVVLVACALGLIDAVWRVARGQDRDTIQLPLGSYLCVAMIGWIALMSLNLAMM